MLKFEPGKGPHRNSERYQCPPFFSARISAGGSVEDDAKVENLGLRGLCARTSCNLKKGSTADIELKTKYVGPIRIRARVRWILPAQGEGSSRVVGLSIHKVRLLDWLRFLRVLSQLKKEVW